MQRVVYRCPSSRPTEVRNDAEDAGVMERTLSDGHVRNDAFDSIFPLVFILAVQVSSELEVLAYVVKDD